MKKYLPSLDEIIPGVIVFVIGMVVWSLVSAPLLGAVSKLKSKVA